MNKFKDLKQNPQGSSTGNEYKMVDLWPFNLKSTSPLSFLNIETNQNNKAFNYLNLKNTQFIFQKKYLNYNNYCLNVKLHINKVIIGVKTQNKKTQLHQLFHFSWKIIPF